MEMWFMESVAFGCIAVGICAIVRTIGKALAWIYKESNDSTCSDLERKLKDSERQNSDLRDLVDSLKRKR